MPRMAIQKRDNKVASKVEDTSRKSRTVVKNKMATPKREDKAPLKKKSDTRKGSKKKLPPTTPARVMPSDSESESEKGLGLISTGKRISRRKTLAVDINKPILVLRPDDDPLARLNLTQREYQEFLLMLNSDERFQNSGDGTEPDLNSIVPSLFREDSMSTKVVITPGVIASSIASLAPREQSSTAAMRSMKCPSVAVPLRKRSNRHHRVSGPLSATEVESVQGGKRGSSVASRYLDYDADSDDEQFVRSLNEPPPVRSGLKKGSSSKRKPPTVLATAGASLNGKVLPLSLLSIGCFERMVSILERQLEVSKIFLREKLRADLQSRVTKTLVSDCDKVLDQTAVFLREAKEGSRTGLAALNKAHGLALRVGAARCRQASARRAAAQVLADLPITSTATSSLATASVDGMLAELSGGDLTGLSFPAPAVHQLLGTVAKGGRNPRAGPSSSRPAGATGGTSTSAVFTCEHLRFLVSEETALQLLSQVYLDWHPLADTSGADTQYVAAGLKSKTRKAPVDPAEIERDHSPHISPAVLPQPVLDILSRVYQYWTSKRAGRVESLLRCYHNFMMDMWHQEPSMPPLPEDVDINKLKETHKQLHTIRHDLDQARLIVDRVRRREKLKKELMRTAGEHFDNLAGLVQQVHTAGKQAGGKAKDALVSNAQWRDVTTAANRCRYSLQEDVESQGDISDSNEEATRRPHAHGPCRKAATGGDPRTTTTRRNSPVSSSTRLKRPRPSLTEEVEVGESEVLRKKSRTEPRRDSFDDVSTTGGKLTKYASLNQRRAMAARTAQRRPQRESDRPLRRSRAAVGRPRQRNVFDFHSSSSEEEEEAGESPNPTEDEGAGSSGSDYTDSNESFDANDDPYDSSCPSVSGRLRSRPEASGRLSSIRATAKSTAMKTSPKPNVKSKSQQSSAQPPALAASSVTTHFQTRSVTVSRRSTYSPQLCSLMSINTLVDRVTGFHH